jgi:ribosomal subunit interface protein
MQPVKIVIRDMASSPALEDHIRKKAEKLSQHYHHINSCQIVIDIPQKHKRQGKLFNVRIDLAVPGKELVVNKKVDEDVYIAIRDAFAAILRQLDSYARKRRGEVKLHEVSLHGEITKLHPHDGYGFIQGTDGQEYYFNSGNMGHAEFDKLEKGDPVQFFGMPGVEGQHGHHVKLEYKQLNTD